MRAISKKIILLLILMFVLLIVAPSSGKKNRKRNLKKEPDSSSMSASTSSSQSDSESKEPEQETDHSFQEDDSSATKEQRSRRKEDKRGRRRDKKKIPILKTSMRAKKITEKKYLKKDWCKSQPVRQHVQTSTNCHGVVISQFCYGQCNSFYIPKDIVFDVDQEIEPDYFKSCSFCKPKTLEWISVRLRCKNIEQTGMPRFITKRIKRVKGCTCIAVPDLEKSQNEDVEILDPESSTSNDLVLATAETNRR